jgi:DinB superfamily
MSKPSVETYPVYFQRYVDQVPEDELSEAFKNQLPLIKEFFSGISEEKSFYAYDEGKWTLKELLQHMIDTERIFNYRALCFARLEKASLPSFEEDDYAANSYANRRSWQEMVDEFFAVRQATELLFKSFTPAMLDHSGISNNKPGTVKSIGFTLVGHVYHHKKVMEERYLSAEKAGN